MSKDFSTVADDFPQESAGGGQSRGPQFNFKRLITMRLPIMVITGVLVAIPLALMAWLATPARYTATAQIRYKYVEPVILENERRQMPGVNYDKFVATEINTIRGNTVLPQVLEDPQVRRIEEIATKVDKLEFLRSRVFASPQGKSEMVVVGCTMTRPEDAKLILETIIEKYNEYSKNRSADDTAKRTITLTRERDRLDAVLNATKSNIAALETQMGGTPELVMRETQEDTQYRESLIASEDERSRLQKQVDDLEGQVERLTQFQAQVSVSPSQKVFDFNVEAQLSNDSRVAGIRQELVSGETRYALLKERQREDSPQLRAEGKKLESLRSQVSRVEQQVRQEVLASVRTSYEEQLKGAKSRVEEAEARVAKYEQQLSDYVRDYEQRTQMIAKQMADLEKLRTEDADYRRRLSQVLAQIQQLELEENAPARVEVAAGAIVPPLPDNTTRLLLVIAAIAAAFGFGVAIGVVVELLDRTVRTPQDLAQITGHKVIACIPHASEDTRLNSKEELPLVTADHPNSLAADEFRRVMARMLYPVDNAGEVRSLLVASPTLGDGKTTFACNLAVALEQANRRVLLVDLSAQRPSVEPRFNLKPAAGLVEMLNGEGSPEEFIRRTPFEHLGIIGPGLSRVDLAGRLGSREMEDFLEWADDHFDHTIIDSPPMLLMADAKMLAPNVDFVALVVGVGKSSSGMITRCIRDIEQLGGRILGIALNGVRSMRGGYMKNNQQLYYAYMDREPQKAYPGALSGFDVEDELPEIRILDESAVPRDRPAEEVVLLSFDDDDNRRPQ